MVWRSERTLPTVQRVGRATVVKSRLKSRSCRNLCSERVARVCAPYAPRCGTSRRWAAGCRVYRIYPSLRVEL